MKKTAEKSFLPFKFLTGITILILLFQLFFSYIISDQFARNMERQRQNSLVKIIDIAYNTINPILNEVRSGKKDKITAQKEIIAAVRKMTFQDEYGMNYIFMASYEGKLLVQPYLQNPEGTNLFYEKDSRGKYYVQEMVKISADKPHKGFLYYYYLPPQKLIEEKKLSYIMGLPEIDAFIGTGVYLESSYIELQNILDMQRYGFIGVSLLIVILMGFQLTDMYRKNRQLKNEIIERTAAEKLLAASEDKYRSLFQSANDTIFTFKDNKIIDCNTKGLQMFGCSLEKIIGHTPMELSPIRQPDGSLSELKGQEKIDLALNGFPQYFEWMHQRSNGVDFYTEISLKKIILAGEECLLAIVRDITDRKAAEEEIRLLAYRDHLTGLPNRVALMELMRKKTESCSIGGCNGALIYIDMDNFKIINDAFSHTVGDMLLTRIADKLKLTFDNDNKVKLARLGGDEYILVLDETTGKEEIESTANEVLNIFRSPLELGENTFFITCSIGIATYPKDGATVEELLKNADLAMYEAKNVGRNCIKFFDSAMAESFTKKIEMEKSLSRAIENSELFLQYQPQIDAVSGALSGYEALLRWNSPKFGLLPPNEFIPLAEETANIVDIGYWVLEESCKFAAELIELYGNAPCVSVNMSAVQFMQSDLVEKFISIVNKYSLPAKNIGIEITESTLMESMGIAIDKLVIFRDKGFRIYLDDFGTGYSSLNYLKSLPIDVVKIDKSFINDIMQDELDRKILQSIVALAHSIGLNVVAEGVETLEQLNYLLDNKCSCIQGYYFSKPLDRESALEFLSDRKIIDCHQ